MLASLILHAILATSPLTDYRGARMIAFRGLESLSLVKEEGLTKTYSVIVYPEFAWDEMVPSWNIDLPAGGVVMFKAKALTLGSSSKAYNLGIWSMTGVRQSEPEQKDADGDVQTDTLLLKKPGAKVELQMSVWSPNGGDPVVRLLALAFRNSKCKFAALPANKKAWGQVIEAPRRSQMSYKGGDVFCSPTAVSMILAHWAKATGKPELDKDVPLVAKGVFDPNWPGTGNWSFNTAYAGSAPEMTAYVARLTDLSELEEWTAAGFPVACSVSSTLIKGKRATDDDGHVVVLVGFTKTGDPVFNDPGRSVHIRQVYKRADFEKAWASSGRTVYLIYPADKKPPQNRLQHWVD